MDEPNYKIVTNEAVLTASDEQRSFTKLQIIMWIVIGFVLLLSFLFYKSGDPAISWAMRGLLVLVAIGMLLFGKSNKTEVAVPIELWFYDRYLIVYQPKRYITKNYYRREYNKMLYKDITVFFYHPDKKKINIYGKMYATWYEFDRSGEVFEEPKYKDRPVNNALISFGTKFSDVDFKTEVEAHSPITVTVRNAV